MKASDISIGRNLSLLLKAPPGFGKTLAAASFALDGPVHLSYWDKKSPIELVSYFKKMGDIGRKILDNIEYDVYGAQNAGEYLEKLIGFAQDCRYFAIINDSITQMTSGAVNWSLAFGSNKKIKDKMLKIIPSWDEYKVETSLVSQALDICRTLPCHVIWTAHPVPSVKIEGSGASVKVTKVNPIVTYGSKVAGIVPGNFSEIYQFSKQSNWDSGTGKSSIKYIVSFDAVGDDYAKSNLGLTGELDITNGLFYQLWKERIKQHQKEMDNETLANTTKPDPNVTTINPFSKSTEQSPTQHITENRTWDASTGTWK